MMRRYVPESPRWLLIHGQKGEAERVVSEIEKQVAQGRPLPTPEGIIRLHVQDHTPWREIWDAMTTAISGTLHAGVLADGVASVLL